MHYFKRRLLRNYENNKMFIKLTRNFIESIIVTKKCATQFLNLPEESSRLFERIQRSLKHANVQEYGEHRRMYSARKMVKFFCKIYKEAYNGICERKSKLNLLLKFIRLNECAIYCSVIRYSDT